IESGGTVEKNEGRSFGHGLWLRGSRSGVCVKDCQRVERSVDGLLLGIFAANQSHGRVQLANHGLWGIGEEGREVFDELIDLLNVDQHGRTATGPVSLCKGQGTS